MATGQCKGAASHGTIAPEAWSALKEGSGELQASTRQGRVREVRER